MILRYITIINKNIQHIYIGNELRYVLYVTCKGHDAVVSLSAGDDMRPAEA